MKKMIQLDLDRRSPVMEIINMSENDVSLIMAALKFWIEMCKNTNLDIYTEQEKNKILDRITELTTRLENEYFKSISKTVISLEENVLTRIVVYWKNLKTYEKADSR